MLGIILSIIVLIKVINYLLINYESKIYAFIYGTLISSMVLIIIKSFNIKYTLVDLIFGIVLFILGLITTRIMKKE